MYSIFLSLHICRDKISNNLFLYIVLFCFILWQRQTNVPFCFAFTLQAMGYGIVLARLKVYWAAPSLFYGGWVHVETPLSRSERMGCVPAPSLFS